MANFRVGCLGKIAIGIIILAAFSHMTKSCDEGAVRTQKPETQEAYKPELSIESASSKQIYFIEHGIEGHNIKILRTAAIKSTKHQRSYYVGAKINGPGLDDGMVGVWVISGTKDDPGIGDSTRIIVHLPKGILV